MDSESSEGSILFKMFEIMKIFQSDLIEYEEKQVLKAQSIKDKANIETFLLDPTIEPSKKRGYKTIDEITITPLLQV